MAVEMLSALTFFATLLGFGILVLNLTKRFRIPDALFLILVGLLFGPSLLNLVNVDLMGDIPAFLRTLALIVIVFASSFHLKFDTFKRVSRISLKLAFGGFFFSMFFLAIFAHVLFSMSWIGSFILSSIIAGTSSSSVVTFRSALKEAKNTFDILLIESIFTDPLTILTPLLLLDYLVGVVSSPTLVISQFWQLIVAGVGTGVVIGFGTVELFKRTQRELSPILGFSIAMITYAAASNVGGSGVLAVSICALILGNLKIPYKEDIGDFEDSLSIMLNISIFTLLGAQIVLKFPQGLLIKETIFLALIIFLARPFFTFLALFNEHLPLGDQLLIAFTGPRGAAAAAIAAIPLSIAVEKNLLTFIPEAQTILLTAFLVILFTVLSSTIFGTFYGRYLSSNENPEDSTDVTSQ